MTIEGNRIADTGHDAFPGACTLCNPVPPFHAILEEEPRLAVLHRTGLLHTPPEEVFDRLTRLAARLLDAPVALVSLLDDRRQFFKSVTGLTGEHASIRGTSRADSICQYVVAGRKPLIIEDAREHALVRDSAAIRTLGVIAYLGVPIVAEGQVIGSLCVNDCKPRQWTAADLGMVQDLCEILMAELALRAKCREQETTLAALRESELLFGELADNVEAVFWMATPHCERLIYVSPAYERVWGRTCASLHAEPLGWMEAIVPEDRPAAVAVFATTANGEPYDIEYRITRPDGSQRWINDRGFPVCDAAGKVLRVCGIAGDITLRKDAEAELKRTNRELREVARKAGMAEVASSVLHNVGNVLNSVNTSISVAAGKVGQLKVTSLSRLAVLLNDHAGNLPAFFSDHPQGMRLPNFLSQLGELESLRKNLEHINEIVGMQQSYAGSGGSLDTLPVAEVIADALRMNTASFERHGTQVVSEIDPALPPVSMDRNKLLLILVNLVRNAKYACDDGGAADKRITVRAQLNGGGCAKISVSDNGVGIPPENLKRIFEHGFTTRKSGHGFGLHSSALAASDMGGSLRVQSDGHGHGATFTIELPLVSTES